MLADRKRPLEEYGKGKKIDKWYLEGCNFETLTPIQALSLGMIWNQTGQAKSQRTFVRGKAINHMTGMANQHREKLGIQKHVTRNQWKKAMDDLIEKGWIHIVRTEKISTKYNTVTLHEHIQVTDYGETMVKKAIRDRNNPKGTSNALF